MCTRLSQHLLKQDSERNPGGDDFRWQPLSGETAALDDRVEADPFGARDTRSEFAECPTFLTLCHVSRLRLS
jgi:hypothetical protein